MPLQIIRQDITKMRVDAIVNTTNEEMVGLVCPVGEEHMYYAAMNSKSCKLTPLGQHYWNLVKSGKI